MALKFLQNQYYSNPLAIRLLWYILLSSSLLTLFITSGQLIQDYRHSINHMSKEAEQVYLSYQHSLSNDLWLLDKTGLEQLMAGLVKLPNISTVQIQSEFGEFYNIGNTGDSEHQAKFQFPISYQEASISVEIGQLTLGYNLSSVYNKLFNNVIYVLIAQFIKTLIISSVILLLVYQLITRHLEAIAKFSRDQSMENLNIPMTLDRKENKWTKNDLLQELVDSFNVMRKRIFNDIKEQEKMTNELCHMANHDHLTQLPNRNLFSDRIEQMVQFSQRNNQEFAILFVDLDDFKNINDTLGHDIGDEVLKQVADRLKLVTRKSDTIARIGGDEFIIILSNIENLKIVERVANKITQVLGSGYHLNGKQYYISPSIGISLFPKHGTTADEIVKCADQAMYMAKKQGKNKYVLYNDSVKDEFKDQMFCIHDFHSAIKNDEFVLYGQPQYDYLSHQMVGIEILIRWEHPTLGLISPDLFIPTAESSGNMVQIGEWVLENTIKHPAFIELQNKGVTVACNVSAIQLFDNHFMPYLSKLLNKNSDIITNFELELTEGVFINNFDKTIEMLNKIKSLGVKIAIDDFGTGFSSLSRIHVLPVDLLKIDKEFVHQVCEDERKQLIIKRVLQLAKDLNINTLAEGVETQEQAKFLHDEGCTLMQGYYYGKPMPLDNYSEQKSSQSVNG